MSEKTPSEDTVKAGKETQKLTAVVMPPEKSTGGTVDRVIRYFSDKISPTTSQEKAEKDKILGLKKKIVKEIGDMVRTDSNIYVLFMQLMERTGATSDIWEQLGQYLEKGLNQEKKVRYSVPPNIEHRNFVDIQSLFQNAQSAELAGLFLRIVLASDERQLALLAKWQTHHENDAEKIWDLHLWVLQVRSRNPDHFRRLMDFPIVDLAPTYEHLVIYLEYLTRTQRFDYKEAQNYIAVNMHRTGPYR